MHIRRFLIFVILVIIVCGMLTGCSYDSEKRQYQSVAEINGQPVGVLPGSVLEDYTNDTWPDSEKVVFQTSIDMSLALRQGLIESYLEEEPIVRYIENQISDTTHLDEYISAVDYGLAFAKTAEGEALCYKMSEFINSISADGTLAEIDEIWFGTDESRQTIDSSGLTGENGTLTLAMDFSTAPFAYMDHMDYVGYEMDIIVRFCREYGYKYTILNLGASDAIMAVQTGLADLAGGCITITEERAESVNFCSPIYSGGIVAVVRTSDTSGLGFLESFADSFYKTFIKDDRYKMILSGLSTTMIISGGAVGIGTLLGYLMFIWSRRRNGFGRKFCRVYSCILHYLPILIVLLILFYIVFSNMQNIGTQIAIIAFAMYFSAALYNVLMGEYAKISSSEIQTALSFGFTEKQAFRLIARPQVMHGSLEAYKETIISTVNGTSIVGYVAVVDLTRASNMISERTYDAIMPIVSTAVIYFLIAFLISFILKKIMLGTDPRKRGRKRILKGVNVHD